MEAKNPHFRTEVERILNEAPFIQSLGVELVRLDPGICETQLRLQPQHQQHDGFVHAGVQATLADHTAGAAAYSVAPPGFIVLTSEFKIHLLRPAQGEQLRCTATVLKPGRLLTVVESEVFCVANGSLKLVSKAIMTMANVERPSSYPPTDGANSA